MDIHAHKNVLACVSPHLMELFSAEQVTNLMQLYEMTLRQIEQIAKQKKEKKRK